MINLFSSILKYLCTNVAGVVNAEERESKKKGNGKGTVKEMGGMNNDGLFY